MIDRDSVERALEEFMAEDSQQQILPVLEEFICHIASTGLTLFPWSRLKNLISRKLHLVMNEFEKNAPSATATVGGVNTDNVPVDDMKSRLISSIDKFESAPFTIQRLCELMVEPRKHYKTTDKFLRAIEKNLLVVSTVDPLGNKIVSEPKSLKISDQEPTTSQQAAVSWSVRTDQAPSFRLLSPTAATMFDLPGSLSPSAIAARSQLSLMSDAIKLKRRHSDADVKPDDSLGSELGPNSSEKCRRLASYFEPGDQVPTTQILGQLLSEEDVRCPDYKHLLNQNAECAVNNISCTVVTGECKETDSKVEDGTNVSASTDVDDVAQQRDEVPATDGLFPTVTEDVEQLVNSQTEADQEADPTPVESTGDSENGDDIGRHVETAQTETNHFTSTLTTSTDQSMHESSEPVLSDDITGEQETRDQQD